MTLRARFLAATVMLLAVIGLVPAAATPLRGAWYDADEHLLKAYGTYWKGDVDASWQQTLAADNVYCEFTVDGYFGSQTGSETREWQQRYGLSVDGVVGPQTYARWQNAVMAVFRFRDGDFEVYNYRGNNFTFDWAWHRYNTVNSEWYYKNIADGVVGTDHPTISTPSNTFRNSRFCGVT